MTDRRAFLRGASVLMGHAALGQVIIGVCRFTTQGQLFQ